MNPLKSDMWKSSKFVQWAIMVVISLVVLLPILIPLYLQWKALLNGAELADSLLVWSALDDKLNSYLLLIITAIGGGTLQYGVFNQLQKRAPTEVIKARNRYGESAEKPVMVPNNFTGIYLKTESQEHATVGRASLYIGGVERFVFMTVEQPWRDNKVGQSSFPAGTYPLIMEKSPKFKNKLLPELKDVPGRSEIKFHWANLVSELEGCIAPGLIHQDINGDGVIDVKYSGHAMDVILSLLPKQSQIIVERDFI